MLRKIEETDNSIQSNENLSEKNILPIHIVLDIDGTLANGFHEENIQEVLKKYPHLQKLADENLFINAITPHLLHPGAIEFIQWIFQIPNVKVSFFSDAYEKRNTVFVQELLIRALGNDFDTIKNTVSIYSRQHLVPSIEEETKNQVNFFKLCYGKTKKNLSKVIEIGNLNNTLLIDDDPSYISFGEEKNVLLVPGTGYLNFCLFHKYSLELSGCVGKYILPMNHIFYIAGMLSKILGMKNDCLANNLFSLQYKSNGIDTYERDRSIFEEHQYYLDGLSELKKINPKLKFYGGEAANEHFRKSSFTKGF